MSHALKLRHLMIDAGQAHQELQLSGRTKIYCKRSSPVPTGPETTASAEQRIGTFFPYAVQVSEVVPASNVQTEWLL